MTSFHPSSWIRHLRFRFYLKGHYHDVTQRELDRHSRPSFNYRKKGQLAQLVRESDLFFRVKRQIKPSLTNVVAEDVKSRMSNAKQGNGESAIHNKPEYADLQCYDVLLILYRSNYHIYKTILTAK